MAEDGNKGPVTVPTESPAGGGLHGLDEAANAALKPAASEFGKEIVPLGKKAGELTNRVGVLLLRAMEPLVYGLEKSGDWIEKAVSERLAKVDEEKIVPPDPRIAVPAMQALTYSMGDELIREMFANLLAADMNAETKSNTHPAFVELIKEMTATDARVLKIVRSRPQASFSVRFGTGAAFYTIAMHYSFEIENVALSAISRSLNNLERLGLLEARDEYPLSEEHAWAEAQLKMKYEMQRQSMNVPDIKKSLNIAEGGEIETLVKRKGLYLNPLGESFALICL